MEKNKRNVAVETPNQIIKYNFSLEKINEVVTKKHNKISLRLSAWVFFSGFYATIS